MIVRFELTMPNVGSWNGQYSGASNKYYKIRKFSATDSALIYSLLDGKESRGFYYNFGDGWGANVTVDLVSAIEAKRSMRISAGFSTYEWMIDSILKYGKIYSSAEKDGIPLLPFHINKRLSLKICENCISWNKKKSGDKKDFGVCNSVFTRTNIEYELPSIPDDLIITDDKFKNEIKLSNWITVNCGKSCIRIFSEFSCKFFNHKNNIKNGSKTC